MCWALKATIGPVTKVPIPLGWWSTRIIWKTYSLPANTICETCRDRLIYIERKRIDICSTRVWERKSVSFRTARKLNNRMRSNSICATWYRAWAKIPRSNCRSRVYSLKNNSVVHTCSAGYWTINNCIWATGPQVINSNIVYVKIISISIDSSKSEFYTRSRESSWEKNRILTPLSGTIWYKCSCLGRNSCEYITRF